MRIAFANDHAAHEVRELLIAHLRELGHEVIDCGVADAESVDYPVMVARAVAEWKAGRAERIIVMCGTGIGVSIAANKYEGIRCALCTDLFAAEMSRRHNNANALALRARRQDPALNLNIIDMWLTTPFEGGRHLRRAELIDALPRQDFENNK